PNVLKRTDRCSRRFTRRVRSTKLVRAHRPRARQSGALLLTEHAGELHFAVDVVEQTILSSRTARRVWLLPRTSAWGQTSHRRDTRESVSFWPFFDRSDAASPLPLQLGVAGQRIGKTMFGTNGTDPQRSLIPTV